VFGEKPLDMFDKLKEMGFEGIEIPLGYPFLSSLPISGIKKKIEQTGLQCVCSTGLDEEHNIIQFPTRKRTEGNKILTRMCKNSN